MVSLTAQEQVQAQKARLPRILLGTSPFVGAGQFGPRSYRYYSHFYEHPENIVKIISRAFDLGIRGIQLLPYPPLVKAVTSVMRGLGSEPVIVGTVRYENPYEDVETLRDLGCAAMLTHGEITDSWNTDKLRELLSQIRRAGSLPGITTHRPLSTLSRLQKADLDVEVVMFPFNKLGAFMDASPDEVLEAARRTGKTLIAKKVLAAGTLHPREGMEFVLRRGVKTMAVGVASEEEAVETFSIGNALLSQYP